MSDHVSFQLTQQDIDAWVDGLTPCPIDYAVKRSWGKQAHVSGRLIINVGEKYTTVYVILDRANRYKRYVEEVNKGWFTRAAIAKHHMRPGLVILEHRDGYRTESRPIPQTKPKTKPKPAPKPIPRVTGKPLDTSHAFDLMRERGML